MANLISWHLNLLILITMQKLTLIQGILLLVLSFAMFAENFLPVEMIQPTDGYIYLKMVESTDVNWSDYRLETLILGLLLIVISKIIKR